MKKLILLFIVACAVTQTYAQRAVEFGVAGSIYQFNRVSVFNYTEANEMNVLDLKMRHAAYTGELFVTGELSNVFSLDVRGGLGKLDDSFLVSANLGLQYRLGHYFKSPYIDPYVRVGVGYFYKDNLTNYTFTDKGASGQFWNVGNKDGKDYRSTLPISFGVGVNMWLCDRFGIGLEGNYNYILKKQVANPISGTVKLIVRLGGKSKNPTPVTTYVDRIIERDKVVEVPVEKIVRDTVVISETVLEFVTNVYFDFDKVSIKPVGIIDDISAIMASNDYYYLIAGHTDAKGSDRYNHALSLKRAHAVRNALIDQGIDPNRLKVKGFDSRIANIPIEMDDETRAEDRKVTITVIKEQIYWNNL